MKFIERFEMFKYFLDFCFIIILLFLCNLYNFWFGVFIKFIYWVRLNEEFIMWIVFNIMVLLMLLKIVDFYDGDF